MSFAYFICPIINNRDLTLVEESHNPCWLVRDCVLDRARRNLFAALFMFDGLNGFIVWGRVKSRNWWFITVQRVFRGKLIPLPRHLLLLDDGVNFSANCDGKGAGLPIVFVVTTSSSLPRWLSLKDRLYPRRTVGMSASIYYPLNHFCSWRVHFIAATTGCRNWQTILSNLLLKCKFDELLLLPKYFNKQKLHYKWHEWFNKVTESAIVCRRWVTL